MRIAIIGGGITGLSTALALHKFGLTAEVFEQAEAPEEVGAGIWVQPNAMEVFNWLGVGERIRKSGTELDSIGVTDAQLNPYRQLKNQVDAATPHERIVAIHRANLLDILLREARQHVRIQLGRRYVRHETGSTGVTITFADADATIKADIVLGADGKNSRVRQLIAPGASLRDAGQVCWRGVLKTSLPHSLRRCGIEAWGKQCRFGLSPLGNGQVYWFAVVKASALEGVKETDPGDSPVKFFSAFSPIVSRLIAETKPEHTHQANLQNLGRLSRWHGEKACLLGDAAHATTPNMGQGACQGVEDAYYISKFLSETGNDTHSAFEQFEKYRRARVDYVVNTSWRLGKLAHNATGQALMRLFLKFAPESVMREQTKKLYRIDL